MKKSNSNIVKKINYGQIRKLDQVKSMSSQHFKNNCSLWDAINGICYFKNILYKKGHTSDFITSQN